MFKNIRVINDRNDLVPASGAPRQQITVDNTVKALGELGDTTTHVLVTVDAANVRVSFDGQDPSTTDGHLITAPYEVIWSKRMAQAAKFTRVSGSATLVAQELTTG